LLGAGAYVGWNIGANDTANCIGTAVGCGLLSFKKAAVLVAVFVIIGAMLQGEHVMKTIGKGIVKTDLNYLAVCVALICSGFFVTLATFYRIPTSTSQAIVGGITGIGLAVGAEINYAKLIVIAESWIVCPLLQIWNQVPSFSAGIRLAGNTFSMLCRLFHGSQQCRQRRGAHR
jgi:PiT family inorganic phosphate transporter